MKIDAELFDICKDFIRDNEITSSDVIFDRDSLQLQALDLLEQICDLIGYHEETDEEDLEEYDE